MEIESADFDMVISTHLLVPELFTIGDDQDNCTDTRQSAAQAERVEPPFEYAN